MFETYLGKKFFRAPFFLYLNMAVFYVQKSELSQSGGLSSAFRFFTQVQFFFLIVWLLSSRFQTDNTKLKFQTNLQIEFLSIVDIYLSYLRATFLLFSFLFIFLALNLTNFVPMELFWNCLLFWRITDNFCDFLSTKVASTILYGASARLVADLFLQLRMQLKLVQHV